MNCDKRAVYSTAERWRSPERPLRLGVIGLGLWGSRLLRVFAGLPRSRVVAWCDHEPSRMEASALSFPHFAEGTLPRAFSSAEDLFESNSVDAVVIATPPRSHADLALRALGHGLHVFVEKPLATSLGAALSLEAAARSTARVVMVGHVLEHHPAVHALENLVRSGALGSLEGFVSRRLGALRREESAWWSLAPHDLGLLRRFLGDPETIALAKRSGTADQWRAELRFPGGAWSRIDVGSEHPTKTRRVVLLGTQGMARFDDAGGPRQLAFRPRGLNRQWIPVPVASQEPLALEALRFESAVLDGTSPLTDAHCGVEVVRWLEAGERSWGESSRIRRPTVSGEPLRGRKPDLAALSSLHPTAELSG